MYNGCKPACDCPPTTMTPVPNGNGGYTPVPSSAPPQVPVCWAAAGATALVAAGATVALTITIANYSRLKPRKLTVQVADPAVASAVPNVAALVNVDSVTSLGRNILGSAAGVNAQAIGSAAENALIFGASISEITASNNIVVTVTNNGPAALRVSAAVEGLAYQ